MDRILFTMALPGCQLHVSMVPPTGYFRIVGRGQASMTPAFVQIVDKMIAGGCTKIALDLRECPSLDSTFSGQLARYALKHSQPRPEQSLFILVAPSPSIVELLDTMYVMDHFCIVPREQVDQFLPADGVVDVVDPVTSSKREVSACCLEAHRVLSALHPSNAAKFQDVVRFLEADLAAK